MCQPNSGGVSTCSVLLVGVGSWKADAFAPFVRHGDAEMGPRLDLDGHGGGRSRPRSILLMPWKFKWKWDAKRDGRGRPRTGVNAPKYLQHTPERARLGL